MRAGKKCGVAALCDTGNFGTKTKGDQYKSTRSGAGGTNVTPVTPKYGMTKKGCVLVGLPVKGVISGSVGK